MAAYNTSMYKIFIIIITFIISFNIYAKQNILIYSGPGAGPNSIKNTLSTIKSLVSNEYNIIQVGPEELKEQDWLDNTELLVMPGGADIPYLRELRGTGNDNIRQFVNNGGNYLGICAGAYYAADYIEFAKYSKEFEVLGARELKFYPGIVKGPIFSGYDSNNTDKVQGMRAASISWLAEPLAENLSSLKIYYNGGGYFIDPHKFSNVNILANYQVEDNLAAIVECKVGDGKVVLSHVHFEWQIDSIPPEAEYDAIRAALKTNEKARVLLAQNLLSRLDIKLQ